MKTIVISDLHIGQYWKSNNSRFSRARKLIQYLKKNLLRFIQYYSSNTNLIIAGDVYDAVSANTEMLVYVANELTPILSKFHHVYAIAGNHEVFIDRQGQQQSLLTIGLQGNNVTIYDRGAHVNTTIDDTYNYIFVPYQANVEEIFMDDQFEQYLSRDRANVIVAHMTPHEIFSFNKFCMNDFIDKYTSIIKSYSIPYILLGHYHMVSSYTWHKTNVVSIGNTYYSTILDVRTHTNDKMAKRFLLINEDGSIGSGKLLLPDIRSYSIINQEDFDSKVDQIEKECADSSEELAIYISSPVLIDYSRLMTNGYDVYFDLIEDKDSNDSPILSLNDTTDLNTIKDSMNGSTLQDRWKRYVDSISNISESDKALCNWLFSKRVDADLTGHAIIDRVREAMMEGAKNE